MEEDDKGCPMIRMGVSGWVFLLVPAYRVVPDQRPLTFKERSLSLSTNSLMSVLHGSMLVNSVNQIHGNCNLRQNIQHKLADLSMYCVKRIYAIQAASSERKCTWGFKMNVFMAVLLFFDSTVTLPQQIHLNTSLVTATDWSINWLSWVLCPTGHKIGHFGDVLISQSQYSAEINKWVWAHYSTGDCELNRLLILATLSIGLHLRGYVSFKAHTTVLTTKFLWCQSSCVERLAIISQRTHTHTHV